ncbi:MAG: hypothetical protein DUD33_03500 [Coriobacteriaceae bacterium]|jgi:hypothetical protein|nr:MAG: hypothetical protein DUD33_03500 [Coriobacteriaceae bacterium]
MASLMSCLVAAGFLWLMIKLIGFGLRVLGWLLYGFLVVGLVLLGLLTLPVLLVLGVGLIWGILRGIGLVH